MALFFLCVRHSSSSRSNGLETFSSSSSSISLTANFQWRLRKKERRKIEKADEKKRKKHLLFAVCEKRDRKRKIWEVEFFSGRSFPSLSFPYLFSPAAEPTGHGTQ